MESRKFKVGDVLYVLFEPEGLWREGEVMGLQERNGVVTLLFRSRSCNDPKLEYRTTIISKIFGQLVWDCSILAWRCLRLHAVA